MLVQIKITNDSRDSRAKWKCTFTEYKLFPKWLTLTNITFSHRPCVLVDIKSITGDVVMLPCMYFQCSSVRGVTMGWPVVDIWLSGPDRICRSYSDRLQDEKRIPAVHISVDTWAKGAIREDSPLLKTPWVLRLQFRKRHCINTLLHQPSAAHKNWQFTCIEVQSPSIIGVIFSPGATAL